MYKEIIDRTKLQLDKAVEFFVKELTKIRTGQATPSLVEDVGVEMYGQTMPLKKLAAISCPGRRQIVIQPWDASHVGLIEKALFKSQLGVSPVVDKELIRVNLPLLTQEFRQNLLKILGEKTEETRKTVRRWREEAWGEIQEKAREGKIREDDKFRGKEELQKVIDEYNQNIDKLTEQKKMEIQSE